MIDFEYEEKHFAYKLFNAFPITYQNIRKIAIVLVSSLASYVIRNSNEFLANVQFS